MSKTIDEILEAMVPRLRAELLKLGFPAQAPEGDDLLQDILVRIWKALAREEGEIIYINSYTKRVVLSVFLNEVQERRRRRGLIEAAGHRERGSLDAGAARPGSEARMKADLADALSALGESRRRAVVLRLEGFSFDEIARLNDWSMGKTRTCYYRGLAEIRAKLEKKGIRNDG